MSNITSGHVRAFQAVRSQLYDNITLASCTINGEGGVAIVMMDEVEQGRVAVMPLFVAITPQMNIDFPALSETGSGGGGGPKAASDVRRAAQEATSPAPNG